MTSLRWVPFSFLVASWAAAESLPTVSWMVAEIPPQMILEGDLAGKGFGDEQIRGLVARLPEYRHRTVLGSLTRNWYEMAHRDAVCFNGVVRNADRERFAVFTHRAIKVPTYGIVIRASETARFAPLLDSAGALDLDLLEKDGGLIGAYAATRSHLPGFDRLAVNPNRKTVLEKTLQPAQLFSLLQAERVDFVIAGPLEARYAMMAGHWRGDLVTLPIKGYPRYNKGYVACSNGPIGRDVVKRLDEILEDDANWAVYVEPMRRWLAPADFAATLRTAPEEENE